jgi:hypothetical protein
MRARCQPRGAARALKTILKPRKGRRLERARHGFRSIQKIVVGAMEKCRPLQGTGEEGGRSVGFPGLTPWAILCRPCGAPEGRLWCQAFSAAPSLDFMAACRTRIPQIGEQYFYSS